MAFRIIRDDISKVKADAIVNSANPEPIYAGGTDYAIYQAAGADELLAERKKIGSIAPGYAVKTGAYGLDAKVLFHTVGPVWCGGQEGELDTLRKCYENCLELAEVYECESIAFPLISTGVYGFPKDKALLVATSVFEEYLADHDIEIILVVFDRKSFQLSAETVSDIDAYIDDNYASVKMDQEYRPDRYRSMMYAAGSISEVSPKSDKNKGMIHPSRLSEVLFGVKSDANMDAPKNAVPMEMSASECSDVSLDLFEEEPDDVLLEEEECDDESFSILSKVEKKSTKKKSLEDVLDQVGETFQESLFRIIDEKGLKASEVYKGANMSKQTFSKIKKDKDYHPSRETAFALALALHLNLNETVDFIGKAGYVFTNSSKLDLIIKYYIEEGFYNVVKINCTLFEYDQALLGNV